MLKYCILLSQSGITRKQAVHASHDNCIYSIDVRCNDYMRAYIACLQKMRSAGKWLHPHCYTDESG